MKKLIVEKEYYGLIEKRGDILGRPDLEVFSAGSAEEVIKLHEAEGADAVVVNIDIPAMGGDALCLKLKEGEAKKTYVVLACGGSKADFKRCEACGANSCIISPVNPDALYGMVCRALDIPERRGMRVLIKVQVEGRFRREPFYCSSRDLSISGIALDTEKILAKGDTITCSFYLPDTDRIDARGEVVRVSKADIDLYQYGVRFQDLSPEAETVVQGFIEKVKGNGIA